MNPVDLSVVLCTWNNSKRLSVTLAAISLCRVPEALEWELVLVNNNCSDNTDSVIRCFSSGLPIVCVHEKGQGLSRARNTGLKAANGRLIVFTDDDVTPSVGWIDAYWRSFSQRAREAFYGGPIESEFEGARPKEDLLVVAPWSVKGLDWGREAHILADHERFAGANWACPAEALIAAGGFDENLGLDGSSKVVKVGEETDLMMRLQDRGLEPWYIPEARIKHFVPANKCRLRHIAARTEAAGYVWARYRPDHDMDSVPAWMYKVGVKLWLEWLKRRAHGNRAYLQYLEYRIMVGRIKGLRDRLRCARDVRAP